MTHKPKPFSLTCTTFTPPAAQNLVSLAGAAALDLLQEQEGGERDPRGALILLCDGGSSSSASASSPASFARVSQEIMGSRMVEGLVVLELKFDSKDNVTDSLFYKTIRKARQVRQRSWVVQVLVVSDDPAFLDAFARWSLRGRLLVWQTRLVVVTRLPKHDLQALLAKHWTLAMMNALVLNLADEAADGDQARGSLYVHLPYSAHGEKMVRLGQWTRKEGITLLAGASLFPQKYWDFHGAPVNVTALPFAPYWSVEEGEGAAGGAPPFSSYSGTDFLMLRTIAEALNFSVNVLPTADWGEVTQRVEERVSFMAPIIYAVLPGRLEHYDYTYAYEYASPAFCMTKPVLKPQWQSLYYPLSDLVWLSALAVLLIMPPTFSMLGRLDGRGMGGNTGVAFAVMGTLLGQNLNQLHSHSNAARLLLGAWLIFAFILGTAYRGNLTAALTLPNYPPRPETLQELVQAVKRWFGQSLLWLSLYC
ncbi:ionotropic receptor 21a-like [Penaeus chinensis]|uniref:ionotropic receptor 21a-like n=1 Tax=Penaeus chinensis TaxID=139456 RepID=UPI001FB77BB3|nr:ionotropic receptor 21a-like [Penaeus chinensis]